MPMRSLRDPGPKCCFVAGVLGWAVAAHGACNGPQAMVAAMRAHPTAESAGTLGSWYASHQQFDCALEAFQVGLKAEPNSAALHYVTGLSLAAMKRPSEAIAELQRSIELDPQQIKPHIILASLYDETDKPEEAAHGAGDRSEVSASAGRAHSGFHEAAGLCQRGAVAAGCSAR
jgi:predicted Zn-dependent protease